MKQRIFYMMLALGLFTTAAYAQDDEPTGEPAETIDQVLGTAPQFTVFARLVAACGLNDVLSQWRDEAYEQAYLSGKVSDLAQHPTEQVGTLPMHRYIGYTVFAETDATWEALLGKAAAAITVEDVKSYLTGQGLYPQANTDARYSDPANIIYQFTTYHILPERLAPDKLVIHYNEAGYYWKTSGPNFTIPVEEFYQTLGEPRLLKLYESAESGGIYLNRFPVLDETTYHENGIFHTANGRTVNTDENAGIMALDRQIENLAFLVALNGYAYPIQQLLAYTENVQNQLGAQRLRFDVAALLPEMMNNDLRRPMQLFAYGATYTRGFPVTANYPYFERLTIAPGSLCYYLSGFDRGWSNYQGDEFNIVGKYDITIQLPPVAVSGEYELRLGYSSGSTARGVSQFFFGTDKDALQGTGMPLDMRVGGQYKRTQTRNVLSPIGWSQDSGNEAADRLVDVQLHELGYMKGPKAATTGNGGTQTLRDTEWTLRRIVWKGYVEAGKTYYLRVKCTMDDDTRQCFLDYIEWCPKAVYANPAVPEDIW